MGGRVVSDVRRHFRERYRAIRRCAVVRVVCLTDMWIWVTKEERVHTYIPFMLAFLRPEWEVHAYYLSNDDNDITVLEKEYGKSAPNFNLHLYNEHDDAIQLAHGDALLIIGGVPSSRIPYQKLLLDIDELRKRYSTIIYYALDSWEGWWCGKSLKTARGEYDVNDLERAIAHAADYVLAVSPQLCTHINAKYTLTKPVYWLPNAANSRRYKTARPMRYDKDNLVCVYIGTLFWARGENNNWDATLRDIASAFPNIRFYIIGSFAWGDTAHPLQPYYTNLIYIMRKGFDENLQAICDNATFFMILQARNVFSYFADPTKWYVYHYLARPILSLNTPHHTHYPSVYPSTVTHHDFKQGIEKMLQALDSGLRAAEPKPTHDWMHRAQTLIDIIEKGDIGYGYAEGGVWKEGRLP